MDSEENHSYHSMSLASARPVQRMTVGLLCQQDRESHFQLVVRLTEEDCSRVVYEGQSDPGQQAVSAICCALDGGKFSSQSSSQVELAITPMFKGYLVVLLPITADSQVCYHQYCCLISVTRQHPLSKEEIVHILQHKFHHPAAKMVDELTCHRHGEVDRNTTGG